MDPSTTCEPEHSVASHSGETSAWVAIQHAATSGVVRSAALPINR